MKKILLAWCLAMLLPCLSLTAKVNPNFHVYLCFGQSNMEGNAPIENQDKQNVPKRFKMMAAVNFSSPSRTKGSWYTATPPLCRQGTGLTPADYFGRTLVENLPDSISVGVINVALGGCSIKMFDEDGLKEHIASCEGWLQNYAREYDNNPFRTLVTLAKKAQKTGVIKGILLHQGESNNTDRNWPQYVHKVYTRLCNELDLNPNEVPLLAGEMVSREVGGICWGHNEVIATLPNAVPNSFAISSKGCPAASDGLHFTAEGYRMIGRNYANVMLDYLKRYDTNRNFAIGSLQLEGDSVVMMPAAHSTIRITCTDDKGEKHEVTATCQYEFEDEGMLTMTGNTLTAGQKEGVTHVKATFTNTAGEQQSITFPVHIQMFALDAACFRPSLFKNGTFKVTKSTTSFQSEVGGTGAWVFPKGLDLSEYPYLVINFQTKPGTTNKICIYDVDDYHAPHFTQKFKSSKTQVVDLRAMKDSDGNPLDPSHIYMVGFEMGSTTAIRIASVYGSEDGENPTALLYESDEQKPSNDCYDMQGRKISRMPKAGLYITNGKVIFTK